MAKRFKLRLGRMIPIFNSCKSKDPKTLPSNPTPLPLLFMLSPVNPKSIDIDYPPPNASKPHHHQSSLTRQVSSAAVSLGCGCRSKSVLNYYSSSPNSIESSTDFQWNQEEKYHVISKVSEINDTTHRRKIDSSSEDCDIGSTPPVLLKKSKQRKPKQRKSKQRKPKQRVRFSTSSAESGGLFSEEEETETFFSSSKTLSTDYSTDDFDTHLATIRESPPPVFKKKKKVKRDRKVKAFKQYPLPETESPARLSSVFQRLMPCKVEKMEGKVKESFAIVKRSQDPFEDFKRSMLEMILEKQMFDVVELEELLRCFLSLNSKHHHGVIVDAFSEIWEGLFCVSDSNQCVRANHV